MITEKAELAARAVITVCEQVSGKVNTSSVIELKSGRIATTDEVSGQRVQIYKELKQQATQIEGRAKCTVRETVSSVPIEGDRTGRVRCEKSHNVTAVAGTSEFISRANGSWRKETVSAAFSGCVIGHELEFNIDRIELTTRIYWVPDRDYKREITFSTLDICRGNSEAHQRLLKLKQLLNIDSAQAHSLLLRHRVKGVTLHISSDKECVVQTYTEAEFATHLSEYENSIDDLLTSRLEESTITISVVVDIQELLRSS